MRLFAFLFGPWYRRMKASKLFRRLYHIGLSLFCVGAGTLAGVIRSFQEASGWTKVLATVIRAGTFPVNPDDVDDSSDTVSLLRFALPGHKPEQRSASMPWWFREHTSHSQLFVWVKGSVISSVDQTGLHWVIAGGIAAGLFLWVLALCLGSWLEARIRRYEGRSQVIERRRRQVARREAHKAEVSTVSDLITLCRTHGRTKVSLRQAITITRCETGATEFRDTYFPNRRWIRLSDLIPHLERTSSIDLTTWRKIVEVAVKRLQDQGVLRLSTSSWNIPDLPRP